MRRLNNFDRLLLGYVKDHPRAMYGEISSALGTTKMIVDRRIQELCREGLLEATRSGEFLLSQEAERERSFSYETWEERPVAETFHWDELYIPQNFQP